MGKILDRLKVTENIRVSGNIAGMVVDGIPVQIDETKEGIRLSVVCSLGFFKSIKADIDQDCKEQNIRCPYYEGMKAFFFIANDGAFDIVFPKVKNVIAKHLTEVKELECPICKRGYCDTAAFSGPYFLPVHRACIAPGKYEDEEKSGGIGMPHLLIGILICIGILLINFLFLIAMDRQMSVIYILAGAGGAMYIKSKVPDISIPGKIIYAIFCVASHVLFPFLTVAALMAQNRGIAFGEMISRWPTVLSYALSGDNFFMLLCIAGGMALGLWSIFTNKDLGKGSTKNIILPL